MFHLGNQPTREFPSIDRFPHLGIRRVPPQGVTPVAFPRTWAQRPLSCGMDPLALLPYALAAAGGRVDSYEVSSLIAAGVTLLQRSASLVRALSGRRSALLLPPGPAWLVALAASDGRGAVLLDAKTASDDLARALARRDVGAVFTIEALAHRLPAETPRVLLDRAPASATVISGDRRVDVDLGSHFGLDLVGDTEGPGSQEECIVLDAPDRVLTHADVLGHARALLHRIPYTPVDTTLAVPTWQTWPLLGATLIAPLLIGGRVATVPFTDIETPMVTDIENARSTIVAAAPTMMVGTGADLLQTFAAHRDTALSSRTFKHVVAQIEHRAQSELLADLAAHYGADLTQL